ncbi:MAG: CRISPR-associated helicase Cas3' [Clostridia bacterium]
MKFIAHTKDGKNFTCEEDCQLLTSHLKNVALYAKKFASSFDAEEEGEIIGLLHDAGKYQPEFQARIRGRRVKVDHATAGAKILVEKYKAIGELYGMAVAGHHTGLSNSGSTASIGDGSYYAKLNKYKGQQITLEEEIKIPLKIKHKKFNSNIKYDSFTFATYIKMLYSSLVDADWTDTEEYITGKKRISINYSMEDLLSKVMNNIPQNDGSEINNIREGILKDCLEKAQEEQGLYTLTVPTGGGKTLSSLAFALKHAKKHNLNRIIYVIPYTSIIEQNADIIANCVGRENVLEHHSNVLLNDENDDEEEEKRIKWASENWDIPIVVTTNVQFFESFFSNKSSKTRKLHNISKSVIIFDEAQMLPRQYLSPCMYAISELVVNYHVTAVLCSATQPEISKYKYDNVNIKEIVTNPIELAKKLKRVKYTVIGKKTDEEIIELLIKNKKALVIVNSRRHAYSLYKIAKEETNCNVFHLSTLMCPMHRREVLSKIKNLLKNNKKVIAISTQLIEAGVDIDFPLVVRSIAGIDSIIQAGGRANREGKLKVGNVYVVEPLSEEGKIPRSLRNVVSIGQEVISVLGENAFELEGIARYFKLLYKASTSDVLLDTKNIISEYEISAGKYNFKNVAEKFKIIEDNSYNVIIPYNDAAKKLIKEARNNKYTNRTLRELQQYSVSIYESEYFNLDKQNVVEKLDNGINILNNEKYYNQDIGLEIFSEDNKNADCYNI